MKPSRLQFDGFYRKHVRLVYATALAQGLDNASAEDATQETFLRVWRHFASVLCLEIPAQRAWLMTTARNIAHTLYRKIPRTPLRNENDTGIAEGPEEQTALQVDIATALADLSDEDRAIVLLRYFQECNSREIGEILDLPEGTVRRRLSECRQRLSKQLAGWQTGKGKDQ